MSCDIAQKLWNKVVKESDKATFTGYEGAYAIAYDEYTHHIEEHGCWRQE